MENALYIGLSRQVALQRKMDLVANNIANVNTPGYRADKMLFEEYLVQPKKSDEDISMVLDYGQYKDSTAGQMSQTGNVFDVALDGPGFMMVETATGTKYTRAGNFSVTNDGTLVTPSGNPVLNSSQGRITVPADATEISITKDGQIMTDKGSAGQIGMVEFNNVQMMRPTGNGFYETVNNEAALPALKTTMRQGMLEGSNVNAVLEMTDLIDISRQYESNQRNLQNEHDLQRTTIQKLTETK